VSTWGLPALALGITLGLGLVFSLPRQQSSRSFTNRLTPWIADQSDSAAKLVLARSSDKSLGWANTKAVLVHALRRTTVSPAIELALRQAGLEGGTVWWNTRLVESGILGAGAGVLAAVAALTSGVISWTAALGCAVLGLALGIGVRRYVLRRAVNRRVSLMLVELPVLIDLLAVSLTAGEPFRDALQRVCTHGTGPLAHELRRVQFEAEAGLPLGDCLLRMSDRLSISPLARTVDHIVNGLERGTPLAGVLRTQAAEVRTEAGRVLQERAASREVVMLIPLIFVILPVTIAFAIFPGLLVIQTGL